MAEGCLCFQGKPFNITVIQVYAPISNAEEAEHFCEDLQDLLELTSKKDVLFIIGDWNAKTGNQEIWSNRQVWPWSTKWSRAKANRVLSREHTGHSKHPFPATQVMTLHMDIIQRSIPTSDDYILCSWRSSSSIQPAKQDLDLTAAQVMSSLLKNSGFNWRKYGKPLGYSGMT